MWFDRMKVYLNNLFNYLFFQECEIQHLGCIVESIFINVILKKRCGHFLYVYLIAPCVHFQTNIE